MDNVVIISQQPQLRLSVPASASPFELIKNAAGVSEEVRRSDIR